MCQKLMAVSALLYHLLSLGKFMLWRVSYPWKGFLLVVPGWEIRGDGGARGIHK